MVITDRSMEQSIQRGVADAGARLMMPLEHPAHANSRSAQAIAT